MLKLTNVSAGYSGVNVIKNISFNVKSNENLSIIGPNGCGKTTLLKVIANILPFIGDIELCGEDFRRMSRKDISLKLAMLHQSSSAYFAYSVFDTVMMGRYPHIKDRLMSLPSKKDKEYVMECLLAVDLVDLKEKDITKLSGGQLQRVFLARALAQEPAIILLDEPTNHLDLKYQLELIEYLKEWSAKGERAVIGVLHDINLAMRLSNNIMLMKDGSIKACAAAEEVISSGILESVYEIDVAKYMLQSLRIWEEQAK